MEHAMEEFPDDLGASMARFIRTVHMPHIETMIRRTFGRIITPLRMSFILGLLRHRGARLKFLLQGTSR
jgi:hypothetical protein